MTIIPAYGNSFEQHYGLVNPPLLTDNYEITNDPSMVYPYAKGLEIIGPLHLPPKQIFYASYVKRWAIHVDLRFGSLSIDQTFYVSTETHEALNDLPFAPSLSFTHSVSGIGGSMSVSVFAGDFPTWEWTREIWVPDLRVYIGCGGDGESGFFGIGNNTSVPGSSWGDIRIHFHGASVNPYDFDPSGSTAGPEGSVVISADEWTTWGT